MTLPHKYRCPSCNSDELDLFIEDDTDWNSESPMRCRACQHLNKAGAFKAAGDDDLPPAHIINVEDVRCGMTPLQYRPGSNRAIIRTHPKVKALQSIHDAMHEISEAGGYTCSEDDTKRDGWALYAGLQAIADTLAAMIEADGACWSIR